MDSFMVIVCLLAVVSILDIVLMYRMIYKLNKRVSKLESIINVTSADSSDKKKQIFITTEDVKKFTDGLLWLLNDLRSKDPNYGRKYLSINSMEGIRSMIERTLVEKDK